MARPIRPSNTAIEPAQMQVPTMDRPSLAFAWFLDSIVIEDKGCVGDSAPYLVCNLCSEELCLVEDGDNLRTLLNTALAHTCEVS